MLTSKYTKRQAGSAVRPRVLTVLRKFPTSKTVHRMSRIVRQFRKSAQNTTRLTSDDALT